MNRRRFLQTTALAAAGAASPNLRGEAASGSNVTLVTLGFGTYGAQSLSTVAAIDAFAKTGFDSVGLALMPGWDTDPEKMTKRQKGDLKSRIADSGLRLTVLTDQLRAATNPDADPADDLERIKRAIDLAHFLAQDGDHPPLLESALGGKLGWDETRELLITRLPAWQTLAEKEKVVIAIKPHRGKGMTRPEHAVEVIRELGDSPWLRINWDYSHYIHREPPLPLVETIEKALPWTALVTVKDTVIADNGKHRFELPGESGEIDYVALLKTFYAGGYRGDIQCEVSAQVWNVKGYDPVAAMRTCYRNMAEAFERAGVPRV